MKYIPVCVLVVLLLGAVHAQVQIGGIVSKCLAQSLSFRSHTSYEVNPGFYLQDGKEPLSAAVEIRVTKAVSGSDGKAPTPVPADADKKSAGPSQQPAIASPPKRNVPSSAEAVSWHMAFLIPSARYSCNAEPTAAHGQTLFACLCPGWMLP